MKHFQFYILFCTLITAAFGCRAIKDNDFENHEKEKIAELESIIDSLELCLKHLNQGYLDKFEPGKAYSLCPQSEQFLLSDTVISEIIYTGSNTDIYGVEAKQIQIKPSYRSYTLEIGRAVCKDEAIYDGCLVLKHQEYPSEWRTIYTVTDTNKVKDYKNEDIDIYYKVDDGRLQNFEEIVCQTIEYQSLIERVQMRLKELG